MTLLRALYNTVNEAVDTLLSTQTSPADSTSPVVAYELCFSKIGGFYDPPPDDVVDEEDEDQIAAEEEEERRRRTNEVRPRTPEPTGMGMDDDEHEHDQEDSSVGPGPKPRGGAAKDAHPPSKRYRLTDKMKAIIWQLVCLSNECCRIENEKKCVPFLVRSGPLRALR